MLQAYPTTDDLYSTPTSVEQRRVEDSIDVLMEPYRDGRPLARLRRKEHVAFLQRVLGPLPAPFVVFESNRAWLIYWVFHSLDLLAHPLDARTQARAISTLLHFQSPRGGFGGGPGQMGHLMSTYAAVCALAIVGGPGPCPSEADVDRGESVGVGRGGWASIDREAMYAWMMRLKQPDGSFLVHECGEIDVRATYCVLVVATLLGICTEELVRGVDAFVVSCQTYEGGFAAQSQPRYTAQGAALVPRGPVAEQPPLGEAHGGYAFCALASYVHLAQLRRGDVAPLDLGALVRWGASLQGVPVEGGAFRGRTNKLVDGCYGWFCGGGLMTLLEALTGAGGEEPEGAAPASAEPASPSSSWVSEDAAEASGDLFDRAALRQYILLAAQVESGGLRDKPGKRPDAYHTCYNLSGLAMCEHRLRADAAARSAQERRYDELVPPAERDAWRRACFSGTLGWTEAPGVAGDDKVRTTHPVLNLRPAHAERMMRFFYGEARGYSSS